MADFSKWIIACEPGLPWSAGTFIDTYTMNLLKADAQQLELDPLAGVLLEFVEGLKIIDGVLYKGSPSELYRKLQMLNTNSDPRSPAVPRSASWLMNHLTRLNPMLRRIHRLEVVQLESERKADSRVDCIRKVDDAMTQFSLHSFSLSSPFYLYIFIKKIPS